MQIKLVINEHTTDSELVHLGNFFSALGLNRGARVFAPPPDEAELEVPEPSCVPLNREEPVVHIEGINILTGKPEPKRRRRTKAEIEAEAARNQPPGPFYWYHPESDAFGFVDTRVELEANLASDPCCDEISREQYNALVALQTKAEIEAAKARAANREVAPEPDPTTITPAPTPTASATDTPAASSSEGAAETPATASPSSVPTPAELNTKAAAVAKKIGPEKIRDHIRELGGTLISTLSPDALVAFNDWLDQQ